MVSVKADFISLQELITSPIHFNYQLWKHHLVVLALISVSFNKCDTDAYKNVLLIQTRNCDFFKD